MIQFFFFYACYNYLKTLATV